jgi:two-component system, LuxR family, sensor kinase FixL
MAMSSRSTAGWVPARNRATWLLAITYIAAFLVLDWASYIRPLQGLNITPWNPQPALAIALLVWSRKWIWLVWAALVAAELVVRGFSVNWVAALTTTIALSLTYAAVAQALARRVDLSHPFATLKDLTWFSGIAVGGSLVSAVLYVLAFSTTGFGPDGSIHGAIARYWVGDAVGLLVTLPILLILMDRASRASLVTTLRSGPWWMSTALTCALLWVVFGRGEQDYFKFFYLLLLPVVWASARFGVAGAVLSSLVTQLGLIAAAQLALRHDLTVFELQGLMAAATMTALLVGVLVDERTRAAAELRSSLRFAAAGQMAAALAHELSQPLTALNNYAHASRSLTASENLNVQQRAQLAGIMQSIADEAQRAGDVVKRLRDFFKSGDTSLQLVPPQATVREAVEAHRQFAERLGVAISSEVDPELPPVWLDPLQMAIVLRNLITNAIESASSVPADRQVRVRAGLDRGRLLVEVRDSGPGVDANRLHSLFDALPSGKPGGLGVGLSICRAIVETHGGKLWAEPGPGGHFFFLLPIDDHDTRASEHAS